MSFPKKIVVYSYYGYAVYFDGKLVEYMGQDTRPEGWYVLCNFLGIQYERRDVKWEDWPGQRDATNSVYNPPHDITVVEKHYAKLEAERKKDRIKYLKDELTRLQAEEEKNGEG